MAKKNKKLKLLKGEKAMYVLLLFLLLAIPMFNVYTSSLLSETNNEVEKLNKNIEKQELVKVRTNTNYKKLEKRMKEGVSNEEA